MDQQNETNKQSQDQSTTDLSQLTHVFPFLKNLSDKNDPNSKNQDNEPENEEFNNMVSGIVKGDSKEQSQFLTGEENLVESLIVKYGKVAEKEIKNLEELALKLPKKFGMLNDFGYYMPKMRRLNLSGSFIGSIEEIGTSFKDLEALNVSNCGMTDLSGLVCFVNLKEFDASHNKIQDLIELEMCSSISVLKLNDNLIEEEENFSFLTFLPNLTILHIKNNPFTKYIANWKFNNLKEIDV